MILETNCHRLKHTKSDIFSSIIEIKLFGQKDFTFGSLPNLICEILTNVTCVKEIDLNISNYHHPLPFYLLNSKDFSEKNKKIISDRS